MKKEDRVELLLQLHCKGCEGTLWGCRGCTIKEDIIEIMNKR